MSRARFDEALALARRAQQRTPRDPGVLFEVGRLLLFTGQAEAGAFSLVQACQFDPARRLEAAGLLLRFRRGKEAKALFGAHPTPIARLGMVLAHLSLGEREAARTAALTLATEAGPDALAPLIGLARAEDLEAVLTLLIELQNAAGAQRGPELDQALLMSSCASHALSAAAVAELHVTAGRALVARRPAFASHANAPDPDRLLTIGAVSQDFRNRSAGHFAEPLFEHLDPARFRLIAYSNTSERDELSDRVAARATWVDIRGLSDLSAAERVRADGVDVLLDLAGHTLGGRLGVFALHPAPVQASYMGYPNTTGLPTIAARLVDHHTDPAPAADTLATERLIRLDPSFLCYALPPHAPPVSSGPLARGAGHVTFGSFNALHKINAPLLDLWASILVASPKARLLLKNGGLADPAEVAALRLAFKARGVNPARLTLRGETRTPAEHLAAYAEVDVALDTFPYHGTTTTLEAACMGVPTVTLVGDRHVSRVGVSLLSNLGLAELIAESPERYREVALGLDAARLSELRSQLRDRLSQGPIGDGAGFGRRFGDALRALWREWCSAR